MAKALGIIFWLVANVIVALATVAYRTGKELVRGAIAVHEWVGTELARIYARKGWL